MSLRQIVPVVVDIETNKNEGWHGLHDQASANINSDGERQELTGNTPKAEFAKPL